METDFVPGAPVFGAADISAIAPLASAAEKENGDAF